MVQEMLPIDWYSPKNVYRWAVKDTNKEKQTSFMEEYIKATNMTIEEKAIDYAERNYSPSFPFHALKLAYREGATEQQNIDIEKACKAHCALCDCKIVGGCAAGFADINDCADIKFITRAMKGE